MRKLRKRAIARTLRLKLVENVNGRGETVWGLFERDNVSFLVDPTEEDFKKRFRYIDKQGRWKNNYLVDGWLANFIDIVHKQK